MHSLFTYLIALVWLINGLVCKVLNLVPRHEEIVARIVSREFSRPITLLIGLLEIGMALWIVSGLFKRFNAVAQMAVIATMNLLEFVLVPDLLLWGRLNAFFAFLFILFIYYNEFVLNKRITPN